MSLFIWDEANRRHIARHNVSTEEAEEASLGFVLELTSYIVDGELRFEELGQTRTGRILKMVIVVQARGFASSPLSTQQPISNVTISPSR